MIENSKLPDSFADLSIPCATIPRIDDVKRSISLIRPVDLFDVYHIFDLANAAHGTIAVHRLINQLIHSDMLVYITPIEWDESQTALLVASNNSVDKKLIGVWVGDIALMFERAALTEPDSIRTIWSEERRDYVRSVDSGTLDNRLEEWGFASSMEIAISMRRLKERTRGPKLDFALRLLHGEIESYENGLERG
ncbi:hypothetical protein [Pseudonocardia yunnanensis]|uniref:Uncharacterized protein n=1 Tax=Pseudonocardia yunnanensis TaxID=58107 RepID=A0ABW4EPK2_9PSEU